ncbi:MAG: phosphoribosylaminoimidazolesuccinocarboxamide synthase [Dehalococcoidia bacterium]|nr:phosphoribosylaminoimidazolesuccinocarboxamide synthase [Dehalococcoidia bacterium]
MNVVTETHLPLPLFQRGKVRDVYDLGDELLIVSTDRISVFDVVTPSGVPEKGRILNQMSAFWFRQTAGIIENHLVALVDSKSMLADLAERAGLRDTLPDYLLGRAMIARKAQRISVECVVRGYLSGSAWVEYSKYGTIHGVVMPRGLRESEQLPSPLFTPTTKSETEHDRPLTDADIRAMGIGDTMPALENATMTLYAFASAYARQRGLIIADTKFEFGWRNGTLILIDEALTPDSSRFWAVDTYSPGKPQPSFDKQPVRDWLKGTGWDDSKPVPPLPDKVISDTTERYATVLKWLTEDSV